MSWSIVYFNDLIRLMDSLNVLLTPLALKYVIGLADPPSALVVFQEIIYLLDHILNVLLNPTDAREFILIGWKPLCLILKVPNYSDNVI